MDAAIRKAKDSIGNMFDKNLHDLVRGIRNHKENEAKYISECIDEIKLELKQDNMAVKANAINKLCYLEMLGYDISWAAFNIIEVMSSTKFTYKRIGYLAASQSFHEGTDVLMLTTNMIRKDLGSQNMYEAGIALSGLSCFLSADLARDLANEIMTLMTSSKPYIRKKAVLIMYKIFLKYPDALRPSFPRLKEKLDDPESSVQAAAVNVICELARKNPKNYLSLAPIFFKLMTISTNNWVLIKIIKLFGALTPLEPRLGKKLIEPLTNLINSTSAMSLLYECINTVLAVLVSISSGQPNHNSAIEICLQKLRILIEDSDQNLKYLGLLAMSKILQTNPKSVQTHKDLIMQCLDDKDESIRLRSLDLLYGMVSKKNLMEIIKKLMVHMNKAEGTHYRDELLAKIVDICSQNNYQHVTNFEWYVSVLVELTRMEGTRHGKLLSSQMLDVAIRVESIRPFIVSQMAILLDNIHVFTSLNTASSLANNSSNKTNSNTSDVCEVLYSATWICGEFAIHLSEPKKTLESMLKSRINNLPGHIQAAFVQNIFKLYTHIINKIYEAAKLNSLNEDDGFVSLTTADLNELKRLTLIVTEKLLLFEQNAEIEVQERACCMLQLLKYVQKIIEKHESNEDIIDNHPEGNHRIPRIDLELAQLFDGDLNPVAVKAQKKVPIPDGLDLDNWINDAPSDDELNEESANENQIFLKNSEQKPSLLAYTSLSSSNMGSSSNYGGNSSSSYNLSQSVGAKKIQPELSQDDLAKYKENRKIQLDSNPFYIKSSSVKKSESINPISSLLSSKHVGKDSASESIRSQSIDLKIPLSIPGVTSSDKYYRMTQIDYENQKLKKKMKNKVDKKKKKKSQDQQNEQRDEEDDEDMGLPIVKVLSNEMPEGAKDDSGDESKRMDPNDPHRALDINLDEPLKENEKLHISEHRSSKIETKSSTKASVEQPEKLGKKKKDLNKKSSEETKKKKKKEKESTKTDLLTIEDDTQHNHTNEYNELLSPDQENLTIIHNLPSSKQTIVSNSTDSKKVKNDDLDFWLSTETALPKETESIPIITEAVIDKKERSKKSKSKKKEIEAEFDSEVKIKEKKKKEKSSSSNVPIDENAVINNGLDEKLNDIKTNGSMLPKTKSFQELAANKQMKIIYQVKPNYMNFNQIIIKLRLKNILTSADSQIHSLDMIILDSASLKLIRNEPFNSECIKLPFSLDACTENEIEFIFSASDCTFPQKLKGTLTYMFKSSVGSAHEKIDFKLSIPCSNYLITNSCDSDDFSRWLSSGQLNSKALIKLDSLSYSGIQSILDVMTLNFCFTVVEIVDNNASLYTSSIQNHPICILMKYTNSKCLSIEAKSTNQVLIENLLDEFKSTLKAS